MQRGKLRTAVRHAMRDTLVRRGATISSSSSSSSSTLRKRQHTASGKRSTSSSSLSSGSSVLSHLRWERPPAARPRTTNIPGFKSAVGDTINVRQRSPVNAMMMRAMMVAALSKVGGAAVDGGGNAVRGIASTVMHAVDGERATEPRGPTGDTIVARRRGLAVSMMMMIASVSASLSKVSVVAAGGRGGAARGSVSAVTRAVMSEATRMMHGPNARSSAPSARDAARRSAPRAPPAAADITNGALDNLRAASDGDAVSPGLTGIRKTMITGRPRRAAHGARSLRGSGCAHALRDRR